MIYTYNHAIICVIIGKKVYQTLITENVPLSVIRRISGGYKNKKEENPFGNSSKDNLCA